MFYFMVTVVHGDIFIWTDDQGIRHFSNVEPPSSEESFETFLENNAKFNSLGQGVRNGLTFDVIKVYDGDSIKVKGAGLTLKVRLVGIDAPESGRKGLPGQPFSRRAEAALVKMIGGGKIRMKNYGTGSYNRLLSEVFTERGVNVNLELVRRGMAEAYRGKPPSGFDVATYRQVESSARKMRRGIWSLGVKYKSPRQWRREHPRK